MDIDFLNFYLKRSIVEEQNVHKLSRLFVFRIWVYKFHQIEMSWDYFYEI